MPWGVEEHFLSLLSNLMVPQHFWACSRAALAKYLLSQEGLHSLTRWQPCELGGFQAGVPGRGAAQVEGNRMEVTWSLKGVSSYLLSVASSHECRHN